MTGEKASEEGDGETALSRIADLLGCDTEAFHAGSDAAADAAEASEMLRLWFAIERPEDRQKVLALARTLAGA